jgi:hypothetical protein
MDMADFSRPASALQADSAQPRADEWRRLFELLSAEVAVPLTAALERVHALVATGRISRQDLRQLRSEVEAAREAGMVGQQLARYGSPSARPVQERLELTQVLAGALNHRSREVHARGLHVSQSLRPVDVIVDPAMLSSLVHALLNWAFDNACSTIELRTEHKPATAIARLTCRFAYGAGEVAPVVPRESLPAGLPGLPGLPEATSPATARLAALPWKLLETMARTMGLSVHRLESGQLTTLTLDLPSTVRAGVPAPAQVASVIPAAMVATQAAAADAGPHSMAGHHVLVLATSGQLDDEIDAAIRHLGLIIDHVCTVDEASAFCRDGLPHAIVFESALGGAQFERLREQILTLAPEFVFVEIVDADERFEVSGFTSTGAARVGRGTLAESLPTALLFELSRGG